MSERGSFVTEYIYCDDCFDAVRKILVSDEKYLKGVVIPHWGGLNKDLPIIAGKVGGLFSGEERFAFEQELNRELAKVICHPLRVAVLPESGDFDEIFTIYPGDIDGRCRIDSLKIKIKALQSALNEIAGWDVKGDSLRDAYDFVFGKGEFDALLALKDK